MSPAGPRRQMNDRLRRYEERSATPLMALAVAFIAVYAVPIIWPGSSSALRATLGWCSGLIWAVFALDLITRLALVDQRWRYLLTHPIDVLMVVLPVLRPLRVLRVFTAGQALITRAGRFSLLRTTQAITASAALLVFIGAVAALDAERAAPTANIRTFPDAMWWAATTVTTVGYGDRYPVTGLGRLVAVALMLVGISLLGLITASVAAWFVAMTRTAVGEEEEVVEERLRRLEEQLAAVHAAVVPRKSP